MKLGTDFPVWGAVLEKAFAKRFGNYEHTFEGTPEEAIRTLTGAPFTMYEHKKLDIETLW